ncbi:11014_t:CDS:2 [Funneliformis caledonium]|uniref:11014_t:CDS:1 n=1 Tax=Funneliformis caledonium TaxID=1117310 RepID=A0A9N9B6P1_9GLOM|nr:11014_t:CDS:2 [Funneliformis caledonium]
MTLEKKKDIISSCNIDLWKVEIEETNENIERLKNTEINIRKEFEGERLSTTKLAKNIFSIRLPEELIHIIVKSLKSTIIRKRKMVEDEDEEEEKLYLQKQGIFLLILPKINIQNKKNIFWKVNANRLLKKDKTVLLDCETFTIRIKPSGEITYVNGKELFKQMTEQPNI